MALGAAGAIALGAGAFSATSQYMAGRQEARAIQQKTAYDAAVYEQQAQMIQDKRKLTERQFNREAVRRRGAIVAASAGKGLRMSGSPLAVLADSETELLLNQQIADYNLRVQKGYAQSGARQTRLQGQYASRAAKFSGFNNAFSTMLGSGISAYQMRRAGPLSSTYQQVYDPTNASKAPADYYLRR
jgi:hypothetical protein